MTYFHYTAAHIARRLGRYGALLLPQPQPLIGGTKLIWFTDMDTPDRIVLGLTSRFLSYSRIAARYVADDPDIRPWLEWRQSTGQRLSPQWAGVESEGRPEHWFVCDHAVKASRDAGYDQVPHAGKVMP